MTKRIPCCIPFCRRGTARFPEAPEIICGPHYRMAPKSMRRRLNKARRMMRRESDPFRIERLLQLDQRLWDRIKAAATETAMGIGG